MNWCPCFCCCINILMLDIDELVHNLLIRLEIKIEKEDKKIYGKIN